MSFYLRYVFYKYQNTWHVKSYLEAFVFQQEDVSIQICSRFVDIFYNFTGCS